MTGASMKVEGALRVLIIDDDADIRHAIAEFLAHYEFKVEQAASRSKAIALLAEAMPDLILMDFSMPGMEAPEFLAQLKIRGVHCPVLLITGSDNPAAIARSLGLQFFLEKPFDRLALFAALNSILVQP